MNNRKIFDPIRQKQVFSLPEEVVRQNLIVLMVEKLNFPKSLISVEKELTLLPHLQGRKLPLRRADILVFGKNMHPSYPLYPLLMIECKRDKLTYQALQQVIGYNYYVQAYFTAIAAKNEIKVVFRDSVSKWQTWDFLPSYNQLLKLVLDNQNLL